MKKVTAILALMTMFFMANSQVSNWVPGTVCSTCIVNNNNTPKGGGNNQVNNGNGTIVNNYTHTACGLGYVQASKRLGRRNPLNGAVQPATFTITGIPPCAIIEKAWVYCGGVSGASTAVNITIVNPNVLGGVYPATMIGVHTDMCWGYGGTRNYRADVTPQISGNGVYTISGVPTNPPTAGQDMNGATLLIVYRDPLQLFTGHIVIGDGCQVGIGGTQTGNVGGFTSCAASTSVNCFIMAADLQLFNVINFAMNSTVNNFVYPVASQNWWDFAQSSAIPAVTAGQTSFNWGLTGGNDCFDVAAVGLYWQTACNNCVVVGMASATASCNGPICEGSQLNLNVVHNATTATTFTWAGPNSFTSTAQNLTFANAQPSLSGVYSVTVEPVGSCIITRTVLVNVYPNPTITALSNNGPVCQGTTLDIGSTANTSATAVYSWLGPNAFSANTQSASILNAMPVASGFYSLTVTNTYTGLPYSTNNQTLTCSATAQMSAAVVPTASLNIVPFFTICQNSNLALQASAAGATSFSWTSSHLAPLTFTSTLANPVINNVSPPNSGDYSVTAYYTSPITTLICTQSAVSNVSVVPRNPVTPFSSANVCQYTTGTFSASALNAAGYQWYGPNGFNSTNQINSITNIQPVSGGNYTVNAIFTIGTVSCTTTSYIPLNVVPVPSVAVIQSITVCERQGATFAANAPNAISYMWSGPNSFTMNSPNPIFANLTPSMSGMYTVTASFSNGNLTCYNSNQTNLLVKPIIPFNLGADKLLCSNSDLFLNGPAGATQYNWWGSTSYTSNTQSMFVPALGPQNSGIYVLEVDLNGCKTYDSVRVDVLTPIIYTLTQAIELSVEARM
ncbi:MAG: hypothetical protein IPI93_00715 [Sphingobacteriaceae bacterium]|nr:hypothetical protein [Sphingobacteriaceae bacterium]